MAHIRVSTEGLQKSRLRAKRRFATMALYFLALISVVFGIIFFTQSSIFSLGHVEVFGNEQTDSIEIENASKNLIEGHYLGLIPKNHSLFYPEDAIANALLAKFPRLSSVTSSADKGSLKLSLQEYKENYLWCADKCFYMNELGRLFAPASTSTQLTTFRRSDRASGQIGKIMFSEDFLRETFSLLELFSVGGFNVRSVTLDGRDVSLIFGEGFKLMYLASDPYQSVYDKIARILGLEDVLAKGLESLSYVDLRFGTKVYYKFRE